MKIRTRNVFFIVAILTCFDSALKINFLGIYLQAGLLLSVISLVIIIGSLNRAVCFQLLADRGLLLITLFTLTHFYVALDVFVYFRMLFYLLMFIALYIFIFLIVDEVNLEKVSCWCILILCFTGCFQYVLTNYGSGFHLRGMDAEYYLGNGDLAYRMRGFFLEPNWFGLVLFSWLYVFYRNAEQLASKKSISLVFLAIICLTLSGNRLILIFIFMLCVLVFLKRKGVNVGKVPPVALLILAAVFFWGLAMMGGFDDRSAAARLYTASQTLHYLGSSSLSEVLFGFGFSNWGEYSNSLELSWSNYTFDQKLTRRDNSELYVVLFEMGVLGLMIYLYDAYYITTKFDSNYLDRYFVIFIYISSFVYPLYSFIMYMMPI